MFKGINILFFISLYFLAFSRPESQEIKWSENRPLKWSDFKAKIDKTSPFFASLESGISYKTSYKKINGKVQVNFKVYAYANSHGSWYKPQKATPALLRHEQLHFNLTQIYAKKLEDRFSKFVFTENFDEEALNIFNEIMDVLEKEQNLYDSDTRHSLNKTKQEEWDKKITFRLNKLMSSN